MELKTFFKSKYKSLLIVREDEKPNIQFAKGTYSTSDAGEIKAIEAYAKKHPQQRVKEYDPNIQEKTVKVAVVDGKEMSLDEYAKLKNKGAKSKADNAK